MTCSRKVRPNTKGNFRNKLQNLVLNKEPIRNIDKPDFQIDPDLAMFLAEPILSIIDSINGKDSSIELKEPKLGTGTIQIMAYFLNLGIDPPANNQSEIEGPTHK